MSFVQGLECRGCKQQYPNQPIHLCDNCFGPVDYDRIKRAISRNKNAARPHNLWRGRELLPIDGESRRSARPCTKARTSCTGKPNTIATSLAIGDPADGYDVIHTIRDSGGWGESATDLENVDAIKLLARSEGIFAEPAGGAEVAVTKKFIEQGRIPRDESIVISIPGNGYKSLEAQAGSVGKPHRIAAQLVKFAEPFRALKSASAAGLTGP